MSLWSSCVSSCVTLVLLSGMICVTLRKFCVSLWSFFVSAVILSLGLFVSLCGRLVPLWGHVVSLWLFYVLLRLFCVSLLPFYFSSCATFLLFCEPWMLMCVSILLVMWCYNQALFYFPLLNKSMFFQSFYFFYFMDKIISASVETTSCSHLGHHTPLNFSLSKDISHRKPKASTNHRDNQWKCFKNFEKIYYLCNSLGVQYF